MPSGSDFWVRVVQWCFQIHPLLQFIVPDASCFQCHALQLSVQGCTSFHLCLASFQFALIDFPCIASTGMHGFDLSVVLCSCRHGPVPPLEVWHHPLALCTELLHRFAVLLDFSLGHFFGIAVDMTEFIFSGVTFNNTAFKPFVLELPSNDGPNWVDSDWFGISLRRSIRLGRESVGALTCKPASATLGGGTTLGSLCGDPQNVLKFTHCL